MALLLCRNPLLGVSRVSIGGSEQLVQQQQWPRFLEVIGGSGGPSGCATGTASTRRVVSGTCAGYPKPVWQSLLGVPKDGVRDIPDVSLWLRTASGAPPMPSVSPPTRRPPRETVPAREIQRRGSGSAHVNLQSYLGGYSGTREPSHGPELGQFKHGAV